MSEQTDLLSVLNSECQPQRPFENLQQALQYIKQLKLFLVDAGSATVSGFLGQLSSLDAVKENAVTLEGQVLAELGVQLQQAGDEVPVSQVQECLGRLRDQYQCNGGLISGVRIKRPYQQKLQQLLFLITGTDQLDENNLDAALSTIWCARQRGDGNPTHPFIDHLIMNASAFTSDAYKFREVVQATFSGPEARALTDSAIAQEIAAVLVKCSDSFEERFGMAFKDALRMACEPRGVSFQVKDAHDGEFILTQEQNLFAEALGKTIGVETGRPLGMAEQIRDLSKRLSGESAPQKSLDQVVITVLNEDLNQMLIDVFRAVTGRTSSFGSLQEFLSQLEQVLRGSSLARRGETAETLEFLRFDVSEASGQSPESFKIPEEAARRVFLDKKDNEAVRQLSRLFHLETVFDVKESSQTLQQLHGMVQKMRSFLQIIKIPVSQDTGLIGEIDAYKARLSARVAGWFTGKQASSFGELERIFTDFNRQFFWQIQSPLNFLLTRLVKEQIVVQPRDTPPEEQMEVTRMLVGALRLNGYAGLLQIYQQIIKPLLEQFKCLLFDVMLGEYQKHRLQFLERFAFKVFGVVVESEGLQVSPQNPFDCKGISALFAAQLPHLKPLCKEIIDAFCLQEFVQQKNQFLVDTELSALFQQIATKMGFDLPAETCGDFATNLVSLHKFLTLELQEPAKQEPTSQLSLMQQLQYLKELREQDPTLLNKDDPWNKKLCRMFISPDQFLLLNLNKTKKLEFIQQSIVLLLQNSSKRLGSIREFFNFIDPQRELAWGEFVNHIEHLEGATKMHGKTQQQSMDAFASEIYVYYIKKKLRHGSKMRCLVDLIDLVDLERKAAEKQADSAQPAAEPQK